VLVVGDEGFDEVGDENNSLCSSNSKICHEEVAIGKSENGLIEKVLVMNNI
jgi:hypothetical protein